MFLQHSTCSSFTPATTYRCTPTAPIIGTPCSPHPSLSVFTPEWTLHAHPSPDTPCSPQPRHSMMPPESTLRTYPIRVTPSHPSVEPGYQHAWASATAVNAPLGKLARITGIPSSLHPEYILGTPCSASQVLCAYCILSTPCSPHSRYPVMKTPSQVLRAHPILGTPFYLLKVLAHPILSASQCLDPLILAPRLI